MQQADLAVVGAEDAEHETAELDAVIALRNPAELAEHNAADGVELFSGKISAKMAVEVVNTGQCFHRAAVVIDRLDEGFVFDVVLVFDLAHDLFKYVFDSTEAGQIAVFVDNDRHVITVLAELLQQHIESFRFWHIGSRAHHVLDVELALA